MRAASFTIGILTLLFTVFHSSAQDSLKVDVNLVNVFATVQDERGEYVTTLTTDDFRIYDDGVEQQVAVFEKDEVDSAVAILLDSSGSMVDILPMMKTGTLAFAGQVGKLDDLCVYAFGTSVRLIHDFGGAPGNLRSRLASLRAYGTSLMFDALNDAIQQLEEKEQVRKALIVFTDGQDNGSTAGFGTVERAAARSGVLMYFVAIGSRVLVDDDTIEALASSSGGRVIYMAKTDSVPRAIDSIREELSRQYYLGYYITSRPGSHKIRVEVPSRPNLRIRAKAGYAG